MENKRFRSSQLTRSGGTLAVIVEQNQESNAIFKTKNDLKLYYKNSNLKNQQYETHKNYHHKPSFSQLQP